MLKVTDRHSQADIHTSSLPGQLTDSYLYTAVTISSPEGSGGVPVWVSSAAVAGGIVIAALVVITTILCVCMRKKKKER